MKKSREQQPSTSSADNDQPTTGPVGKQTRAQKRYANVSVQRKASSDADHVHAAAEKGIGGQASSMPHLAPIQKSFGKHDVSAVQAHVGGPAAAATEEMGAEAFAAGDHVAFKGSPDLHTAAHEAAHVVQQRAGVQLKGGVGQVGDSYEQQADQVADQVVQGQSAEATLDQQLHGGSHIVPGYLFLTSAAPTNVQLKTVTIVNFDRLADKIHKAIAGLGTDEDAVYSALAALHHEQANIDELKKVYKAKFGNTLVADIKDDFSGSELAYAMSLLTAKKSAKPEGSGKAKEPDYDKIAAKVHSAIAGMGTDEEGVYAALAPLDADAGKIKKLKTAYKSKYGVTLLSAIMGDFSGDELKHVLELIGARSTNETVNVSSDDEAKKAAQIIKDIYVQYGIDVNSQAGVDAIKKDYKKAPKSVRDGLKVKAWEYKELVALKKALDTFSGVLGDKRKTSTRSDTDQELRTVSKVAQGIDVKSDKGVLDNTTMGEFFGSSENVSVFTAGTDSTIDFSDNKKQLQGTAVHELTHALMKYAVPGYISELEYWDSKMKKSGKAGVEAPITAYGTKNAEEDFCEAVMFYSVDKATLKNGKSGKSKGEVGNPCPVRLAYIEKTMADMQKKEPK